MTSGGAALVERVSLPASLEAINDHFIAEGWSDGLPIVPPTPRRVERMLRYSPWPADAVLGPIPPSWAKARTVDIAVCAVMAGCLPTYFPVVVTAVIAALEPTFNLAGAQGTTNPAAPMILVNGPLARELDINSGAGVLGPGWRANATIGRALRLVLLTIGGGRPGLGDMCTLGNPAKYTCCLAEDESATSWNPLHVERGLPAHSSAVTLFAGSTAQNVIDKSKTPDGMLKTLAEAMMAAGSNNIFRSQESLLVLGPEHACFAARAGITKQDARQRLFAWSRIPLDELTPGNAEVAEHWRHDRIDHVDGRAWLRAVVRPEDLLIVVAGGQGNHSLVIPGWDSRAVTKPLALPDGRLATAIADFRRGGSRRGR